MEINGCNQKFLTFLKRGIGSLYRENLKSNKLEGVSYDVRGPVLEEAERMQEEGHQYIKIE